MWMKNLGYGKPLGRKSFQKLPGHPTPLTAPANHTQPALAYLETKTPETGEVTRYSVIVEVALPAISQSRSGSVGSRLIRQVLAVCDGAGRFCRGEKTSGSASAEPFGEEKERNAMHPD